MLKLYFSASPRFTRKNEVRKILAAMTILFASVGTAAATEFPPLSEKCEMAYSGAFAGTLSHTTGFDYALNLVTEIKFNPNSGRWIRDEVMVGRLDPYALLDATFAGLDVAQNSKTCLGQLNAIAAGRRAFEAAAPEIIHDYLMMRAERQKDKLRGGSSALGTLRQFELPGHPHKISG
jgi:hypothetical protein